MIERDSFHLDSDRCIASAVKICYLTDQMGAHLWCNMWVSAGCGSIRVISLIAPGLESTFCKERSDFGGNVRLEVHSSGVTNPYLPPVDYS